MVLDVVLSIWRDIIYDYCIFGLPSGFLFLVGGASMVSTCPLLPLGVGIPVVVDDVEGAESVGAVRSEGGREGYFRSQEEITTCTTYSTYNGVSEVHTPGRLMGAMRPVGVVGGKRNVPN